ncbi:MAG: hypothetical protein ACHQ17_08340, partial [Polyangia bacterium]
MILVEITLVLTLLVWAVLALAFPSQRLAAGRAARLWRVSGLGARLWTSWLGARARRLFAGKK